MYHVINNYQSAYIKRRQLGINARTIHDNINKSIFKLKYFHQFRFFFTIKMTQRYMYMMIISIVNFIYIIKVKIKKNSRRVRTHDL